MLETVTQMAIGRLRARVSDCIETTHNPSIAMTDETGLPIVGMNFQHQLVRRILVESKATVLRAGWVVAIRFRKSCGLPDDASIDTDLDGAKFQPTVTKPRGEPGVEHFSASRIRFPFISIDWIRTQYDAQRQPLFEPKALPCNGLHYVSDRRLECRSDPVTI